MGTFISLLVFLVFALLVVAALRRLFRWAFRRDRKRLEIDHNQLNDVADEVAKATRTAALVSSAAAYSVAPTGIAALGAKIGLVSVPLIVVIAPKLGILAGGVLAVSSVISLYSKYRRRKETST
ncbi:hypothetical protein D3C85_1564300 [compost metagenome]